MPRNKQYKRDEVIEKAMNVFWKHGFKITSMQTLEKEMGINKFSIYSDFENKNGLLLASIECYKSLLGQLVNELREEKNGRQSIENYFYQFLEFSKDHQHQKGCLITNTALEFGELIPPDIKASITDFTTELRNVFYDILLNQLNFNHSKAVKQADYLLISMFGLSSASRLFSKQQISHFIDQIITQIK